MYIKEIIEIVLTVFGLVTSLIVVYQSRKSIKLTEKSIRDANRPYIGINIDYIDTVYYDKFILIKNYGNTSAKIIDLSIKNEDKDLNKYTDGIKLLINGLIMPGQKFTTSLPTNSNGNINFKIKYSGDDGENI